MAVYTRVTAAQVTDLLASYDVGAFKSFDGILQGVENTNYHVFTDKGRYVLTLFEKRVNESDLPFFFSFTGHLAQKGIRCPAAIADKKGKIIQNVASRPAVLISFLEGSDIKAADITAAHCGEVGKGTARLHIAAADFDKKRENTMYLSAWKGLFAKTKSHADEVQKGLSVNLEKELAALSEKLPRLNLPSGTIHADLFPDNVFFKDGHLHGFLDFYFSCTGFFAYDLALVINSWCFDVNHDFCGDRFKALMTEYESLRKLTTEEKESFSFICQAAAVRIVMTRLHDWIFHDPQSLVKPKDPREYIAKLRFHQEHDVING